MFVYYRCLLTIKGALIIRSAISNQISIITNVITVVASLLGDQDESFNLCDTSNLISVEI